MSQRKKENAKIKSLENKVSQMQLQKKPKRKKRPTPFGDTGSIIGNRIGGMFGRSDIGKGVGRWLGSGIGSIFGSGDYSMTGQQPAYNVLVNGSQVPQFDTTRATNVVCHREYLGDIIGTTAFNNTQYPLNPGISQTFPWLSSIAANYQEFKFHGIIFEFRPLITDYVTSGAPGVVVLATNYNADVVNYTTKQQMENSEFAVSIKPTMPVIHGIECADDQTTIPHRYVRTGAVPTGQDLRLYDLGNFQFATQQNPVQDLGELWVSYCVEFFKPIIGFDAGEIASAHATRASATNANPLGTVGVSIIGTLPITVTGTTVSWNAQSGISYMVELFWSNVTAVAFTPPAVTVTNGTLVSTNVSGNPVAYAPTLGVVSAAIMMNVIVAVTTATSPIIVSLGTAGTIPAGSMDIYVVEVDAFTH